MGERILIRTILKVPSGGADGIFCLSKLLDYKRAVQDTTGKLCAQCNFQELVKKGTGQATRVGSES